jgi:ABC-2 type transport system ATP-binding protein
MPNTAIDVLNVTKKFKNFIAVDNLSFSILEGENFGILGPNGAGKTTTIEMMMGLQNPTSGKISILGMDLAHKIRKIRQNVALVPQTVALYKSLTVYENIKFFGTLYKKQQLRERMDELINTFHLEKYLNTMLSKLSGGYQRRTSLACALIADPKIIFLDEPLTGIDIITNKLILDYLKAQKNITIVYTTHSIQKAEGICDKVLFIDNGKKILEGKPREIIKNYSSKLGEKISIEFDDQIDIESVKKYFLEAGFNLKNNPISNHTLSFNIRDLGPRVLDITKKLEPFANHVLNIDIRKVSLEEVFNHLATSHENTLINN